MADTDSAERLVEAFVAWFEEEGFLPQASYADEEALKRDLGKQLDAWIRERFSGWRATVILRSSKSTNPIPLVLFGYSYTPDIELVDDSGRYIPMEVKLMKTGWEPNQAIGQATMFSRWPNAGLAIGAVLDVRKDAPPPGQVERSFQKELWEKFGVRLCVRKAQLLQET